MKPTEDRSTGPAPSSDTRAMMLFEANRKSMAVSYILWIFVGVFGGHRFYNGRTATAVTQLLMWLFGDRIVPFIDKYFNLLSILFTLLLVGGFAAIKLLH